MNFKPLAHPPRRLADQVYDQIMAAIRSGQIGADDRIVQEKLADDFNISRTPVREALFRMEQEGILIGSSLGRFKIRVLSETEIRELYSTRCAIEGFAARILAENLNQQSIRKLRSMIRKTEKLKSKTVEAYFAANLTIHRTIVEATGNRFLLEFFDNIWNRGSSFTLFATIKNVDLANSLGDHLALIDAIATGSGLDAEQRMIEHINDGLQLQIKAGEFFTTDKN